MAITHHERVGKALDHKVFSRAPSFPNTNGV